MREKKPINIRVGRSIQLAREERHLTQEELSERLEVTPNHLSAIERGVSGPSLELIEKLCKTLEVSADYLLFGQGPEAGTWQEMASQIEALVDAQQEMSAVLKRLLEERQK